MTIKIINMAVANDDGNGFTKTYCHFADGTETTTLNPSVYTELLKQENLCIGSNDQELVNNYLDKMDVVISSHALKQKAEYLVGKAALNSGNILSSYNVCANEGKILPDISVIIPLAKIAYEALKQSLHQDNKGIPTKLKVNVSHYFTCLPINQFKKPDNRQQLIEKIGGNHKVEIANLGVKISINIHIDKKKIKVMPEGFLAQVGLIRDPAAPYYYRQDLYQDSPFKDGLALDQAGNILLIDLGDGTTDFCLVNGLRPISNANISLNYGTGTAAAEAANSLSVDLPEMGLNNKALFLQRALQETQEGEILRKKYLNPELGQLMQQITREIEIISRKVNGNVAKIIVLGGGANLLTSDNKAALLDTVARLNPLLDKDSLAAKIWYIPQKYSQLLNLDGLKVLLNYAEAKDGEQQ